MGRSQEDWNEVVSRLNAGDRRALLQLSRLVTSFLIRWRAYDFRDEWDDVIQDVIITVGRAASQGRIRDPRAVVGFIRTVARRRFIDMINRVRTDPLEQDGDEIPWEGESHDDQASELRTFVARLPEKQRIVIEAVYFEGRTREDAAEVTGIPLGSLKRYQKLALERLRTLAGGEA